MKNKMSNPMTLGSALLVLASAGAWAWSAASESSKPAPAQPYAVRPVADPYKILLQHSLFARDGRATDTTPRPSHGHWGSSIPATTQSTTGPAPTYVSAPPEASYVLKGVAMQDGTYTAFFEQTTENKGIAAHSGETIARGQIVAMNLDGVDYSYKGRPIHILIGQDLAGKTVDTGHSSSPSAGSGDWHSRWHHDTPAATTPAPGTPPAGGPPTANGDQGGFNRDSRRSRDERGGDRGRSDERGSDRGSDRANGAGPGNADAQAQQPGQPGPDANGGYDPNGPRRDGPGPGPSADPRDREADAGPVAVPVPVVRPDDIPPEFIDPN